MMSPNFLNWLRDLIIISKKSLSKIYCVFNYPQTIIPQRKFKRSFNLDDLATKGEYIIVRRSERPPVDVFDEFGSVRIDALINTYQEVRGLSMNLLSNIFKVSYIAYNPKNPASKDWEGESKLHMWLRYISRVEYLRVTTPIYFQLSTIHKITFPFHRNNSPEYKKLMKHMQIALSEVNGKIECTGESIIVHKPNKLNYWHVEFHIRDSFFPNEREGLIKNVKNKSFNATQLSNFRDLPWQDQLAYLGINNCLAEAGFEDLLWDEPSIVPSSIYIANKS